MHQENAHEHTGEAEAVRPSLRNGFTAYIVLSPAIGLSCRRHQRDAKHHHQLDASVGASGPHGFAVRIRAVRYRHIRVHRIPSRVRDDREPPLQWDEMAKDMQVIWVGSEGRIFLAKGLDRIC